MTDDERFPQPADRRLVPEQLHSLWMMAAGDDLVRVAHARSDWFDGYWALLRPNGAASIIAVHPPHLGDAAVPIVMTVLPSIARKWDLTLRLGGIPDVSGFLQPATLYALGADGTLAPAAAAGSIRPRARAADRRRPPSTPKPQNLQDWAMRAPSLES